MLFNATNRMPIYHSVVDGPIFGSDRRNFEISIGRGQIITKCIKGYTYKSNNFDYQNLPMSISGALEDENKHACFLVDDYEVFEIK